MKTLLNKSQTFFKFSFFALTLIFGLASCGSDDDGDDGGDDVEFVTIPAEQVTSYTGAITYTGDSGQIVVPTGGVATISGSSSNYTISFSDEVPSISGLRFSSTDGSFITVGDSNIVVEIDDNALTLTVQDGAENWVFAGNR